MLIRFPLLVLALSPLVRAADKATFDEHVLPVFQQSCLHCLNPDKARGGLDLSTYAGTMKGGSGGKIVGPGDTGSPLVGVVEHTREPKMPPQGDKLAATLSAIDSVIVRLRDDHRHLEAEVIKARAGVESSAPGLARSPATKLRRDYLEWAN